MRWLPLSIAILLLAVPVLAQTGTPPGPDLQVTGVRLPSGTPRIVDGTVQGDGADVEVTVRNNGPTAVTAYQLLFRWAPASGGDMPLNGGEAASADVWERPLNPQETRTHALPWRLQPGQAGAGAVRVIVQAGGAGQAVVDARPADNQGQVATTVEVHALRLVIAEPEREIHPGETIFLRAQLHNDGNVAVDLGLEVLPGPGSARLQSSVEPGSVEVAPGASREALVFVTMPVDDDATPLSGSLALQASRPVGSPRSLAFGPVRSTFAAYGPDDYKATLSSTQGTLHAGASRPASALWTVRNVGLEPDVYGVRLAAPDGWTASAAPARFVLDPGHEQVVRATFAPPQSAPPGQPAQAVLTVASEHPVPANETAIDLRVAGAAPEIAGVQPRSPASYVGDQVELVASLANEGDRAVGPSMLQIEARMPDGSLRTAFVHVAALAPGEARAVPADLGLAGPAGTMQVDALWSAGNPPAAWQGEVVLRQPELDLAAPAAGEGLPGEALDYALGDATFRMRNLGALAETWHLRATASAGTASVLGEPTVTLLPGEARSIPVRQVLPQAGPDAGKEVPLTLTASLAERPSLEWVATVATRIADRAAPSVLVASRPGAWSLEEAMPVRATAEDLSGVREVVVEVAGAGANRTLGLERIGNATWGADVVFLQAGMHVLRVHATDAAGNLASTRPWNVSVEAGPVPRLSTPDVPDDGTWRTGEPIDVRVEGTVRTLRYRLTQDGEVVASGDVPVSDGLARIPMDAVVPGEAVLRLEAASAAGSLGELLLTLRLVPAGDAPGDPPQASPQPAQDATAPHPALLAGALASALAWARRRGRR